MSTDGSDSTSPLNDKAPAINVTLPQDNPSPQSDEDEEPPQLSSEQLLRRASFKKILEDLSSSADALNKPSGISQLVSGGAASVTPSQVSVLQQAAGLAAANPALLPILQNLQQSALATAVASQAATAPPPPPPPPPNPDFTQQLAAAAMMLPGAAQLNAQQQLTAALLHSQQAAANTQSPLIANAVSLAGHNNLQLPANLLSSALLNASSNPLTNFGAQLASTGNSSNTLGLNKPSLRTVSNTDTLSTSPLSGGGGEQDSTKKREVRLMKNREAARECRRKKKEYIRCLENRVAVLESQNQALIGELRALKELYLPKNQE